MCNLVFMVYLCLAATVSIAQPFRPGLFLSSGDFRDRKISFSPVEGKKYSLHLFYKPRRPMVKVVIGESSYLFSEDSLFGYSEDGKTVKRFYERSLYTILNPFGPILLYRIQVLGGHKNKEELARYYFSTEPDQVLKPLTRWNLKLAFPTNQVFHELLDLQFHSDNELTGFDAFTNQFKVNHLLEISDKLAPILK